MEIMDITKQAIVLDGIEKSRLIECLVYCYHRLSQHGDCGLRDAGVKADFVDYMIKELRRG